MAVVVTLSGWDAAAGAAEAAGYAAVVEEGGTCTLTLERAGTVISVDQPAVADAASSSCGLMRVTDPRLSGGRWTATLSYSSASATGSSGTFMIEAG